MWVDPTRRFQALEGFGAAFSEAAAVTRLKLGLAQREAVLRDGFDPEPGHGHTLCRVHMKSCDFALGNYAHADAPGDVELRGFNIDRDRQALLPFIKAAQRVAGAPIKLLVSAWSPPAWMKSNGQMNHGGTLLPRYAAAALRCCRNTLLPQYAAAAIRRCAGALLLRASSRNTRRQGVPVWGGVGAERTGRRAALRFLPLPHRRRTRLRARPPRPRAGVGLAGPRQGHHLGPQTAT